MMGSVRKPNCVKELLQKAHQVHEARFEKFVRSKQQNQPQQTDLSTETERANARKTGKRKNIHRCADCRLSIVRCICKFRPLQQQTKAGVCLVMSWKEVSKPT